MKSPADVKDYLTKQVSSSVRWQQTIERLIADGADEFVDVYKRQDIYNGSYEPQLFEAP